MAYEYGLNIKRNDIPKADDESFQSPRPQIKETKDQERLKEVYLPPEVNHDPAAPVVEHVVSTIKSKGNNRLAELIALATEKAKQSARAEENEKLGYSSPRVKPEKIEKVRGSQVIITDDDKCDDEIFIRRTMSGDIHSEEFKRLFYANGGKEYVEKTGLLYAQAF